MAPRKTAGRKAKKKAYQPTYQVGSRVAQVALEFASERRYVTVDEIVRKFEVDTKTARRYLAALRSDVFNGVAYPWLLVLEDREGKEVAVEEGDLAVRIPFNRIARAKLGRRLGDEIGDTPTGELLPVYLALTVVRFLRRIVPEEQVAKLWRELAEGLAPDETLSISNFDRKFFSIPYAPKDYADCQEELATVTDAVVRQHVLSIDYYGLGGDGKRHRFEPWTLVMYKGGLYVLGRSDRHEGLIYLAVERIDRVERLLEDGQPVRFRVPTDFSPDRHSEGVFGIIEGPETVVELEIQNPETEARLKERMIHRTQEFVSPGGRGGSGKTRLRMRVRGTTELAMWVLSQGPFVRVLEPESLRLEVKRYLDEARSLYA